LKYFIYGLLLLAALSGCSDSAIVKTFDKDITTNKIPCLRLVVFPSDEILEQTLNNLYKFTPDCEYRLEVSKKGGIVCNSNQNAAKKTLSNFPSTYLRMDVSKENRAVYSYYIDLLSNVSEDDVKSAFLRLKKDILKD